MYPEYKNYYKTLGVDQSATKEAIKKAFRDLARKHHPDAERDDLKRPAAEEKIKEINEAYEVLGDPEKRKKYDELGANWQQARAAGAPGGSHRHPGDFQTHQGTGPDGRAYEFHFGGTGFSDFFEQYFSGGGFDFGAAEGEGFTPESGGTSRMQGRDLEAELMVTLDEVCRGASRQVSLKKVDPQTGKESTHTYNVRIPKGVREGQRLRVSGQGGAGVGGGPPGDLYLRTRFAKHPDFRIKGSDLYYELALAPWEAVLGTKVPIATLHGKVNLSIKPGTQNGQRQRLKGQGLPKRNGGHGDLFAEVTIRIPEKISESEAELWKKLQDETTFTPRK